MYSKDRAEDAQIRSMPFDDATIVNRRARPIPELTLSFVVEGYADMAGPFRHVYRLSVVNGAIRAGDAKWEALPAQMDSAGGDRRSGDEVELRPIAESKVKQAQELIGKINRDDFFVFLARQDRTANAQPQATSYRTYGIAIEEQGKVARSWETKRYWSDFPENILEFIEDMFRYLLDSSPKAKLPVEPPFHGGFRAIDGRKAYDNLMKSLRDMGADVERMESEYSYRPSDGAGAKEDA